jgi:tetratricopeptide (TPR) repeat protein
LPAVLLLIDYYKERRFEAKVFVEKIPFFILSFVFAYIALQSQSDVIKDIYTPSFPIYERIFLASYAIVFYVFKFFLPTQLVHLYGYPFVNEGVLGWQYYVAPVFVAFFAWAIFRNRSKREVIFGSFFFLINVALVLQLIPVGKTLVADRYSYLSYIGLGFIIAYWYHHFTSYHKQPKLYWQLTLIVCFVALSVATFKRNQVWKDSFSLWSDALAKSPSSYLKYYYQFGLAGIKREATQYQDAIKDYDAVIALNPKFSLAYHDRAICKVMLKDFKGAMEDCSKAIELDKNFALAYNTRGYAQMQIYDMKLDYARKALQDFSTAISLNPEYTQAYYNRGLAKYDLEKNDEAILDYTKALELSPNYAMVYNDRAAVKYRLQDFKGAIADYTKAIELAPDLYDLYYNRGSCHIFLKQYQNAIDDFSKFLQYKPDIAAAYYYRSMAYLESNNRVNACQDLQKAFQLGERLAQQAIDKNCK